MILNRRLILVGSALAHVEFSFIRKEWRLEKRDRVFCFLVFGGRLIFMPSFEKIDEVDA